MRLTRVGVALIVFLILACPLASIVSYAALTKTTIGPFDFGPAAPTSGANPRSGTPVGQGAAPTPTNAKILGVTPTLPATTSGRPAGTGGGATAAPTLAPTLAARPTTGNAPTATAAGRPTASPTAAPAGTTVTVAYDAYAPYFPVRIAEQQGYFKARNIQVGQIPFGLGDKYNFDEEGRRQALRDGRFDVLLTTLDAVALFGDDKTGKVVAIVDESAGADKIVARAPIARLNDLKGKRIAYSNGSVAEFFLYANLSLAGLKATDVQLVPKESVDAAVKAFTAGQADAVVGWEPVIEDAVKAQNARVLIGSDNYRAILDVVVVSTKALNEKPAAIQAFLDAWFEAVKLTTDDPRAAGAAVVASGDSDWTGVNTPADLSDGLGLVAQATLGQNAFALREGTILAGRIREAQSIWRAGGRQVAAVDPARLIDTDLVQKAAERGGLDSTRPPINPSFVLTSKIVLPRLTPEQIGQTQAVAELPLKQIAFLPDSATLTEQGRKDLLEQVVPVLKKTPGLYLRVDGSAAQLLGDTEQGNEAFARDRARAVISFLVGQGIDVNRLIEGYLKPRFPNSLNEDELAQDRRVVFTLVQPGGR